MTSICPQFVSPHLLFIPSFTLFLESDSQNGCCFLVLASLYLLLVHSRVIITPTQFVLENIFVILFSLLLLVYPRHHLWSLFLPVSIPLIPHWADSLTLKMEPVGCSVTLNYQTTWCQIQEDNVKRGKFSLHFSIVQRECIAALLIILLQIKNNSQ